MRLAALALVLGLLLAPAALAEDEERPGRVGAAGWCGKVQCDQGVAAELKGWKCKLFPGRWCGVDALLGRETAGFGARVELTEEPVPATSLPFLPPGLDQEIRLSAGAGLVSEYGALEGAEWSGVAYLRASW